MLPGLCWYARCYVSFPEEWEYVAVRRNFRSWILVALILSQVQLAVVPAVYAEPPESTPALPVTGGDAIVDMFNYVFTHPLSEGTAVILLMFGLVRSVGWSIDAAVKWRGAREARTVLLDKAKEVANDYELHKAEYREYPARIKELSAANEKNNERLAQLKGKPNPLESSVEIEKLHREIDKNDRLIQAMTAKTPFIRIGQAINAVADAEAALNAHIERISSQAPAAVRMWGATKRPAYIGEWLQSPQATAYLRSRNGRRWHAQYKQLLDEVGVGAAKVTEIYNSIVQEYNAAVPVSGRVPRLDFPESPHGRPGDYFLLTPEVPSQSALEVRREDVVQSTQSLCNLNLARLSHSAKQTQKVANFRRAYRQQVWSFGSLAAVGTAVGYYWNSFQDRYKQSITSARANQKIVARIHENEKTDLAGQIAEEKKGRNRLNGFMEIGGKVIADHQKAIVDIFAAKMGLAEKASGRDEMLKKRVHEMVSDPGAEKERIAKSLENATFQVFNRQGMNSLDRVLVMLYTEDEATRNTVLRSHLKLVFRETTANLYPEITDEKLLDDVEMLVVPDMVKEITEKLKAHLEERKKSGKPVEVPMNVVVPGGPEPTKTSQLNAPSGAADPTAQLHSTNSGGVSVNSLAVLGKSPVMDPSIPSLKSGASPR
jgi:hypothetical protein